jgi:hypothetical protein
MRNSINLHDGDKWIGISLLVGMALLLLINCFQVVFNLDKLKDPPWKVDGCPLPYKLSVEVSKPHRVVEVRDAITQFNKQLKSYKGNNVKAAFFEEKYYSGYKIENIVAVREPSLLELEDEQHPCHKNLDVSSFYFDGIVAGATLFSIRASDRKLIDMSIVMCFQRMEEQKAMLPYFRKLKYIQPMKHYIQHELLHVLLGDKHLTEKEGCSVFCSVPKSYFLSATELLWISSRYNKLCKDR